MPRDSDTPIWIELTVECVGNDVRVSARGSRDENPPACSLGKDWEKAALLSFAKNVQRAAEDGVSLDEDLVRKAYELRRAVLGDDIGIRFGALKEATREHGPMLVRFLVKDAELQAFPWECLCESEKVFFPWASSPEILPARGIISSEAFLPPNLLGAVRVLAISPISTAGIDNLKTALDDRIATGEMEWLPPIQGEGTVLEVLVERLHQCQPPNVIHFLGHGGLVDGAPVLQLAERDGSRTLVPVAQLAQEFLAAGFQKDLQLVVLEACEGAASGVFASAAETFLHAGINAVVAHLWPVKAEIARDCSEQFYRALVRNDRSAGNVAVALNEARRMLLGRYASSAEAFSPVLYLRKSDAAIFDFEEREVKPPTPPSQIAVLHDEVRQSLARIVKEHYTLVLGDRHEEQDRLRQKLQKDLAKSSVPPPEGLPMSTLAEWFALRKGAEKLATEFQKAFPLATKVPPVVSAVACVLCPGVHITLLRSPWLEQCLAEAQPSRTIYVLQPSDIGVFVMQRKGGTDDWEELDAPPERIDFDRDILFLRPYRGYTPEQTFTQPLLTEDDFFERLHLWSPNVLPEVMINSIKSTLSVRPALVVGCSMLAAEHRIVLHQLHDRGLPHGSVVVVEKDANEVPLWYPRAKEPEKKEALKDALVVLEADAETLAATLETIAKGMRQ